MEVKWGEFVSAGGRGKYGILLYYRLKSIIFLFSKNSLTEFYII